MTTETEQAVREALAAWAAAWAAALEEAFAQCIERGEHDAKGEP